MTHAEKVLKRYKLGLAIFMAAVAVMTVVFFIMSAGERADGITLSRLERASSEVENYKNNNNKLPAKGSDVKLHESLEYKKVSDSVYLLCADFKTERKGNDASSKPTIENERDLRELRREDPDTNYVWVGSYFSRYFSAYKEGRNCFYLEEYDYSQPGRRYDDLPVPDQVLEQ